MSTKTRTTSAADWHLMCDDEILRLLAEQGPRSVAEMADHFHVTETTIRYRLIRLRKTRKVSRKLVRSQTQPRRPTHLYFLTPSGRKEAARCIIGSTSTPRRRPMCDHDILRLLAEQGPRSVAEMVAHFRVTETAIRLRLEPLMRTRAIVRKLVASQSRIGRPKHLYFLPGAGRGGDSR